MSYTAVQLRNARAIVAEVKSYPGLGDADHRMRACDIALATVITESNLLVYANSGIPVSLKLPHDAVGHDNDSGYRPGNVRWASAVEQQRNRRDRRKVES